MHRLVPLLLPLLLAAPATAQEDDAAPGLREAMEDATPAASDATPVDTVVVTATRREEASFDVPAATTVITADTLFRLRAHRTLTDALQDTPSVLVQKTAYGQSSPFIRGFTGYRNLFLVDGVRLNNSTFRSGPNQYWSTVDAFTVDRLEVVRGPASVLHGSDALGGTVNAVTRRRESFEPGRHFEFHTFHRWASAERSWTGRAEVEGNVDDVGFVAGTTWRFFDDLDAGGSTGRLDGTGYDDDFADLRLDWRATDSRTWTLAFQHADQDRVPRTETTRESRSYAGTAVGSEFHRDHWQNRDLAYVRFEERRPRTAWADRVEATLSWQRQRETRERDRNRRRMDHQAFAVTTLGGQVQVERSTSIGDLTLGAEWWHDGVDSRKTHYKGGRPVSEDVQGPVGDDALYDLAGVYVQDSIECGDTRIVPGVRFNYAAARAREVDNPDVPGTTAGVPYDSITVADRWTAVVGSLRASHALDPDTNLFAGVSQGFRAPSLSDLTVLDSTSGFETPSPGLDEERLTSFEVGAHARGDGWALQATVWHASIDGLIVASPTGTLVGGVPEVRKDNVGDGWARGVEFDGRLDLADHVALEGVFSWSESSVDQLTPGLRKVGAPLDRQMPMTSILTLRWDDPAAGAWAWVSGRWIARADELALRDRTDTRRIPPGGSPGYSLVSAGIGLPLSDRATIGLVCENLFDADVRVHGSGVNEPGRNLVATLDVWF